MHDPSEAMPLARAYVGTAKPKFTKGEARTYVIEKSESRSSRWKYGSSDLLHL
jgi:hypothetical protein